MTINRAHLALPQCDLAMTRKFIELLVPADGCLEMRAIGKKEGFHDERGVLVSFYDDIDAMVRDAEKNHCKRNVYIGLNPRNKFLVHSTSANGLRHGEGGKAEDILYRSHVLIDIDVKKENRDAAATEKEMAQAEPLYFQVLELLEKRGIDPIRIFSGNGRQLIVPTVHYGVLAGEEPKRSDTAHFIRWLGRTFSTSDSWIDIGVYDTPRITRLPGIANLKGDNIPERPWRTATFEVPTSAPVPVDLFAIFRKEIVEQRELEANANGGQRVSSALERQRSTVEMRNLVHGGAPEGMRNTSVASAAGHLLRRHVDPLVALDLLLGWNRFKNTPPLPDKEVVQIVNSICKSERKRRSHE